MEIKTNENKLAEKMKATRKKKKEIKSKKKLDNKIGKREIFAEEMKAKRKKVKETKVRSQKKERSDDVSRENESDEKVKRKRR